MNYEIWQTQSCDVISLKDQFNAETVNDLRPYFDYLIKDCAGDVLVDMISVKKLDPSGVGALLFLYKRLKIENRKLALVGVNGKPGELLSMLRINRSIKQYNNMEDYFSNY
ncbi:MULTISPECIES: STAS domain-containing protein [unclassified Endozoicomonas]|uniref:STAS domain-containing protein n=1 Tax=unclassified Endozoicomonas TaxID=2644528 RepID=UPI0021472901|nr:MULTISPECIES: STAS domain-containing protein [unclassified Endozoicomonas]